MNLPTYFSNGECVCGACGRIFGSVSAFDTHKPGLCDVYACTGKGVRKLTVVERGDPARGTYRHVWVGAGKRDFEAVS